MKRILSSVMLALFGAALIVGCEASAKVGDDDADVDVHRNETTYKKTTVRESDGDVHTKTEIKRD